VSPVRIRVPPLLKVLQMVEKLEAPEGNTGGFGSNTAAIEFCEPTLIRASARQDF
jgi:hypothetical protein